MAEPFRLAVGSLTPPPTPDLPRLADPAIGSVPASALERGGGGVANLLGRPSRSNPIAEAIRTFLEQHPRVKEAGARLLTEGLLTIAPGRAGISARTLNPPPPRPSRDPAITFRGRGGPGTERAIPLGRPTSRAPPRAVDIASRPPPRTPTEVLDEARRTGALPPAWATTRRGIGREPLGPSPRAANENRPGVVRVIRDPETGALKPVR